jgi:NADPH-dependent curcumin reductase CurA
MQMTNGVPQRFRKLVVTKLSRNFRDATELSMEALPAMIKPTEVMVENSVVGVNASDINFTAGSYRPSVKPPFDCGFEAMGTVIAIGEAVRTFQLGDKVMSSQFGGFSEIQVVSMRKLRHVKALNPAYMPLEVSATTASIALEQVALPQRGETALVTAGAGGTGHFAVQILKRRYGCHVVATCSSPAKKAFLESLGCDRVIDYKAENVRDVLSKEYPRGVNVVYESVGGDMFQTALDHLATKGRLVVIGSMSGYHDGSSWSEAQTFAQPIGSTLLSKSASVRGFFLPHYQKLVPEHLDKLVALVDDGKLVSAVDPRRFHGIDRVPDAVEHLLSGQTFGKVVVHLDKNDRVLSSHF